MQGKRRGHRSAVGSGVLTGLSTAAVSASAALAGLILARKFGHGVKTDGFFAAYSVYLALVLVANALRVVLLPRFARSEADGRLAREVSSWAIALAALLAPLVVLSIAAPHWVAGGLTGGPKVDYAADLLPWLVAAAAAQVFAGVAASALGALDDYATAALGFALGGVAGLIVIVAFIDHGVVAFGWGLMLNGVVALVVPGFVLIRRRGLGGFDGEVLARLAALGEGVALPFALQGLFVIGTRFAQGLGNGPATTFSYAYLIAALLVAVTATSFALVSSVPLTRGDFTGERAGRHIVAASWLSLTVIAAAAGVFALAGERVARWGLGSEYGGDTGAELGRLVVYFAPWMVISVALSVAFPLLFVRGRARWLPLLALAALGLNALLVWAGREAFDLAGIAAGMIVTTGAVLVVLLWSLGALAGALRGLVIAAVVCGGVAAVAFAVPRALLGPVPAALAGLALYSVALTLWRPAGLRTAWAYARDLQ